MLNNPKRYTTMFAGKEVTIETGRFAKQSSGSALVTCGETVVLAAAVGSAKPKAGQSFFPLTVDYLEKFYSAGRIPGGYFKRETQPSSLAKLTARLMDRPLRPLFPEGFLNDVNVVVTLLSLDGDHEPEILGSLAASAALSISNIPFMGPTAAARVGRVDGKLIVNPNREERKKSDMDIIIAGTKTAVMMVEGGADEVPEDVILEAIWMGHAALKPVIELQEQMAREVGKEKMKFEPALVPEALKAEVTKQASAKVREALATIDKMQRQNLMKAAEEVATKAILDSGNLFGFEDADKLTGQISTAFEGLVYQTMREQVLTEKTRIDRRKLNQVRPIETEVSVLPRTHGSALFTRGETQALVVCTLGTGDDEQMVDALPEQITNTFMLHYNFPPYSVGETGPLRAPGRREIGHGALAERAIVALMPKTGTEWAYTTRIVSEVMESNGSSSMATVCGSSMALMDAGVPLKAPCAGIAMGLIKEGDRVAILSDILGDEDHLGDMDFKVAGSSKGVTAIQMDIKIGGLDREIMSQALKQAHEGRIHILGEMAKSISTVRSKSSKYAPQITTMKVKPDKVREVIGSGGKVIRGIIEATGVKIDIDDTGLIRIASADEASSKKARDMIEAIVTEPEVGGVYRGKVKRIVEFGAFVEILPGCEGLLHVSEIAAERVNNVGDFLKEGEYVEVKLLEIDRMGKLRLSRKALLGQAKK